jgi:beta-lactamase regulating signal transducer with metallopeptidase domain
MMQTINPEPQRIRIQETREAAAKRQVRQGISLSARNYAKDVLHIRTPQAAGNAACEFIEKNKELEWIILEAELRRREAH